MPEVKPLVVIDGKNRSALDVEPPRFTISQILPTGLSRSCSVPVTMVLVTPLAKTYRHLLITVPMIEADPLYINPSSSALYGSLSLPCGQIGLKKACRIKAFRLRF